MPNNIDCANSDNQIAVWFPTCCFTNGWRGTAMGAMTEEESCVIYKNHCLLLLS